MTLFKMLMKHFLCTAETIAMPRVVFSGVLSCSSSLLGALRLREKSCASCAVLDYFHGSSKDGVTKESFRKHNKWEKTWQKWEQHKLRKFRHLWQCWKKQYSNICQLCGGLMETSLEPCSHPAPSLYHFLPFAVLSLICWKLFSEAAHFNAYIWI